MGIGEFICSSLPLWFIQSFDLLLCLLFSFSPKVLASLKPSECGIYVSVCVSVHICSHTTLFRQKTHATQMGNVCVLVGLLSTGECLENRFL